MNTEQQDSFLRIPPFPGAKVAALARQGATHGCIADEISEGVIDLVRELKVGGTYWGDQPDLPFVSYVLVRVADRSLRRSIIDRLPADEQIICWADEAVDGKSHLVSGKCDPWHLLSGASRVIVDAQDELALVASAAGIATEAIGQGANDLRQNLLEHLAGNVSYFDPFSNQPMSLEAAVRLCGFWRKLVDGNRDITGAVGFAFWKRPTVSPLLWGGRDVNFTVKKAERGLGKIAVWKSRAPASVLAELEQVPDRVVEVEDGFIRSAGLGADCVPPLSIVVDRLGVHFDPSRPSELERLIEEGTFPTELVERARELRGLIVSSGVSKYGSGALEPISRVHDQVHILVPGQVEDDRAVICGSGPVEGNLDLLRRVRAISPDATILYKPHPDVEAGHRVGAIADDVCLEFADRIVRDKPISGLIETVDEVHVNTSLAGFEALLRSKPVITHGVPFYSGWGLTRDLGPVPGRRTARRTIDELVAAVLLQYPRYLDPVTGLPCPPEGLVRRISEERTGSVGAVVQMRRMQGRLKKGLASLRAAR